MIGSNIQVIHATVQRGSLISSMVGVEANTVLPRDGDVNLTFESGHLLGITRFGGNVYE